jgi:hypothetical protein
MPRSDTSPVDVGLAISIFNHPLPDRPDSDLPP